MGRYRKIDPRVWNDEKVRELSDDAKLVFLFGLTHPYLTQLGAMRATLSGLAEELKWPIERLRKAFGEAFAKGIVKGDDKAPFIWFPNFLKYNRPESPNVIKSWGLALDLLPECPTKNELIQSVKAFTEALPKAFREALPKAFTEGLPKGLPNQEQEQKQEQKREKDISTSTTVNQSTSAPKIGHREIDFVLRAIRFMASRSQVFEIELMQNGDLEKKITDWSRECSGVRWIMFCTGVLWARVRESDDGLSDPFDYANIPKPLGYLYAMAFPRKFDRQPTFDFGPHVFDERRTTEWWWRTFFEKDVKA